MNFIVLVQLYFDYVLPRDDDWFGKRLPFDAGNYKVWIRPRNLDEELFPNEIDKTLSSMALGLKRLNYPQGQTQLKVAEQCHDRIEAQIHGEIGNLAEIDIKEKGYEILQIAIKCCNVFLSHCRTISRVPFVHGVERHFKLQDNRSYILTPYSISWSDDKCVHLPVYNGVNATASSGAVLSPERGQIKLEQVVASLNASIQPNLPRSFYVDADEYLRTGRLREATVAMAMACEVASNEFLQRVGRAVDSQVEQILRSRHSFAEKRLHEIPQLIAARSLQAEQPATYTLMEHLYRTRNNVVHQGKCVYMEHGRDIEVDERCCAEFLQAVDFTLDWIENL